MKLVIKHAATSYHVFDKQSKLYLSEADENEASYGGVWQPKIQDSIAFKEEYEAQASLDHMESLLRHIKREIY